MEDYVRHIFICTASSCSEGDPSKLRMLIHQKLKHYFGFDYQRWFKLTKSNCLGQCGLGPNMVIYPDGVWYKGVKPSDIEEIVEEHLLRGRPVERLLLHQRGENFPPFPDAAPPICPPGSKP